MNKTILITGATAGIGKETARGIAKTGANIVIVGRSKEKTAAVAEELKRSTNNEKIEFLVADLSLMSEIRRCADEFKSKYDRLDILVNNAGAIFDKRETTADGLEKTFALNHISYFLLTNLLLDLIKQSQPARIVSVSSAAHNFGKLDFDNLQSEKSFGALATYSNSKLMNVLFTYELARRLKETKITANCLHPGGVASNFGDNMGGFFSYIVWFFKNTFAISSEKGAETSVFLATSPEVENVTGKYFDNKKAKDSSKISYDESLQKRLWEKSEEIVGQKF
jgi:NAD(P)-dependent dehydrogenase (short-subunit alcohol dehydrogenase family)